MHEVFISYPRTRHAFASWLKESLETAKREVAEGAGYEVYLDVTDIPGAVEWWAEIKSAIEDASAFLFVLSLDSLVSPTCQDELAYAIACGKRIVPVALEDVNTALERAAEEWRDRAGETAAQANQMVLRSINCLRFEPDEDHDAALAELVAAIDLDHEHLRTHQRLWLRANEWKRAGKSSDSLLRGKDLTGVAAWLIEAAEKKPPPVSLHEELIASSLEGRRRRRIAWAVGSTALVLLAALGAGFAGRLTEDAFLMRAHGRALEAGDRSAALQLLKEVRGSPTGWRSAAASAQHGIVPQWQAAETVLGVSPDGKRLASLGSAGEIQVRWLSDPSDATTLGEARKAIGGRLGAGGTSVVWAGDGQRLLVVHRGLRAGVWDVRRPESPLLTLDPSAATPAGSPRELLGHARFDPSGDRLAVAVGATVRLWRFTEAGPPAEEVRRLPHPVRSVAWSGEPSRCLARVETVSELQVWDVGGNKAELLWEKPAGWRGRLEFPDRLLTVSRTPAGRVALEERSILAPTSTGRRARLEPADPATDPPATGTWHHYRTAGTDGRWLVVETDEGEVWLADLAGTTAVLHPLGQLLGPSPPDEPEILGPAGAGQLVVGARGEKRIWLLDLAGVSAAAEGSSPAREIALPAPLGESRFPEPSGRWLLYEEGPRAGRRVGSPSSGFLLVDLKRSGRHSKIDHPGERLRVEWGASETLLTSSDHDTRIWKLGQIPGRPMAPKPGQEPSYLSASGDRAVLFDSRRGEVEIWPTGQSLTVSRPRRGLPRLAAIGLESERDLVVTVTRSSRAPYLRTIEAWNCARPGAPCVLRGRLGETPEGEHVKTAAVAAGTSLVAGITSGDQVLTWDALDQSLRLPLAAAGGTPDRRGARLESVAIDPSGKVLHVLSLDSRGAYTLARWEVDENAPANLVSRREIPTEGLLMGLALSAAGDVAAYGQANFLLGRPGRVTRLVDGRDETATSMAFSPSGKRVLAMLMTGTAVVWDTARPNRPWVTLEAPPGRIELARFGESDDQVLSVTRSGLIASWEISAEGLRRGLEAIPAVCLLPWQRADYLGESPAVSQARHAKCETKRAPARATDAG